MKPGTWLCAFLCTWLCTRQSVTSSTSTFRVYWNVPSQYCAVKFDVKINVSQFGLLQNAGDAFHGDKVNILYGPGAFPHLSPEGTPENGGIPQNGSLPTHLQTFINTLNKLVPIDFVGAAVLDFENYYPSYALSSAPYRQASRAWVRTQHPDWTPQQVESYAAESFNTSARNYFQSLLWVGRELRPGGLWGYYHYPYCHNYYPKDTDCTANMKAVNDDTEWLFKSSAALYPSLYEMRGRGFNFRDRRRHIRGVLHETFRMRRLVNSTVPILPYMWSRYHDSPDYLSPVDVVNTLGQARLLGVEGAVVWGSTADVKTEKQCTQLKSFAEGQLGPLVRYLAHLPRARLRRVLSSRRHLKRNLRKALRGLRKTSKITRTGSLSDLCANNVPLERCNMV